MQQTRMTIAVLLILVLAHTGCGRAANVPNADDLATLAAQLEAQGGTVIIEDGRHEVMVASGLEEVAGAVSQLFLKHGVKHGGYFSLGHGGIYVRVEELEKARRLLIEEQAQGRMKDLWIFNPEGS